MRCPRHHFPGAGLVNGQRKLRPIGITLPLFPGAIGDLEATAVSSTAVLLVWSAAARATGHQYRVNGGAWQTASSSDEHTVTGLNPDTYYEFQVRGTNLLGGGPASNVAGETTEASAELPAYGATGPSLARHAERDYIAASSSAERHACGFDLSAVMGANNLAAIDIPLMFTNANDRFTVDFYRRSSTDPNLNTAPPVAGDTLIYSAADLNPANQDGIAVSAVVKQALRVALPTPIAHVAGTVVVVCISCTRSGTAQPFILNLQAVTTSPAQIYRGWYYASSAWSNLPTGAGGRTLQLVFLRESDKTPITGYATPIALSPETREIMEWIKSTNGGATLSHPSQGSFPGVSGTVGEGLSKIVSGDSGASAWPAGQMQRYTDFGRPNDIGSAVNVSTGPHGAYLAGPPTRTMTRDTTTNANKLFDNRLWSAAYHDFTNGAFGTVSITNSIIDSNNAFATGVNHNRTNGNGRLVMSRSDAIQQTNFGVLMQEGVIDRAYIYNQYSDALRVQGKREKRLMRSLFRQLGQGAAQDVHADCIQTDGSAEDFIAFQSTLYMPYGDRQNATSGPYPAAPISDPQISNPTNPPSLYSSWMSPYWEGTDGVTNLFNFNTNVGNNSMFGAVNCLGIGGGYSLQVTPDDGESFNGGMFVGLWFSLPYAFGGQFTRYGPIYPLPGQQGSTSGTVTNLLIHNCRFIEDQTPICMVGESNSRGFALNGFFNYNKATCPYYVRLAATILGYLDANGDPLPGANMRTGFV